jgi:uncharacterized cupredoxin-like copper-binding protein
VPTLARLIPLALASILATGLEPGPLGAQSTAPVVHATLSEWHIALDARTVPAGRVAFQIVNRGTIPHAFEVEGQGVEKETATIPPGASASLELRLKGGSYEIYCPVGNDSHKKLGMLTTLTVGSNSDSAHAPEATSVEQQAGLPHAVEVRGGGSVIQILPGPFPFADSAAAVIASRPEDQRMELTGKAKQGPYSDSVARVSGTIAIRAWDFGPSRDSVDGTARFTDVDGSRWKLVMDRVQTKDIPNNPRFGGVIMGLYYHGASGVHTPLVPTIQSSVALWAYGRLYRDDRLVTDSAMVHVMLLSRTRRDGDFKLDCWDCSKRPVEELQLQITPAAGQPKLEAPGGFLFLNWEKSSSSPV